MAQHLNLIAVIDGHEGSRERVLEWEFVRARKVLTFLGAGASDHGGDVDVLRTRLYELKRSLGPAEVQERIAGRVRLSTVVGSLAARAARGSRVQSSIKIRVPSGTAEGFAEWFNSQSALADSDAMLAGCPDHYFIGEDDRGRQKVVETTGGSPLPSEFFIDYADISSLVTPPSADYPIQIAGVARTDSGLPIGGVRHQFRNLPEGGFETWNTVEFPKNVGNRIVAGHRWHLSCEFGNWIEFYQA
jgi:hypothetical protein